MSISWKSGIFQFQAILKIDFKLHPFQMASYLEQPLRISIQELEHFFIHICSQCVDIPCTRYKTCHLRHTQKMFLRMYK